MNPQPVVAIDAKPLPCVLNAGLKQAAAKAAELLIREGYACHIGEHLGRPCVFVQDPVVVSTGHVRGVQYVTTKVYGFTCESFIASAIRFVAARS